MKKAIMNYLEDNGFRIYEDKENNSLELENWTDGGVNIFISIEDKNNIVSGLEEYLNNFDIDEEIDLYREDKNYRDNFTIRESVKDFEDWIEKVKEVKVKIETLETVVKENKDMNKSFEYLGYKFIPQKSYKSALDSINLHKDGIFPQAYNHTEFYNVAKANRCGNYDTFLIELESSKRLVIPTNNGFHYCNER